MTGTTDPADIAAVIAALTGGGTARDGSADPYEQWRLRRTAALRASRGR
ncbi:MAG TPA: hypothetical protein VGH43_02465 [Jatrophihabitans sp.]